MQRGAGPRYGGVDRDFVDGHADEVLVYKTDPTNDDTDDDKLDDGDEVFVHQTDPRVRDTHDDRLTDGAEVNLQGTNPLVADTDEDGLSDGDEFLDHAEPVYPGAGNDVNGRALPRGTALTQANLTAVGCYLTNFAGIS